MPNRRTRIIRWKAAAPLALFLALVAMGWYFFLDATVRRSIEAIGTELVGAKVDLAEADVRLREGSVTLRGLQVTNPDAPMTNLFEVDEIVKTARQLVPVPGAPVSVKPAAPVRAKSHRAKKKPARRKKSRR